MEVYFLRLKNQMAHFLENDEKIRQGIFTENLTAEILRTIYLPCFYQYYWKNKMKRVLFGICKKLFVLRERVDVERRWVMKIKKQNLLLLASLVWMIAGFNVLRIGIETYAEYQTVINYIVTIIVFLLFWFMVFYKLTNKHTIRIQGYEEEKQLFYKFFDLKSFLIMAFMISFGIIIRSFHLLPERFIAVFYTGLGAALFMAGVLFGRNYIQAYRKKA